MSNDVNDLLFQEAARSFEFNNLGDTVSGRIVSFSKRQQTDMQTNAPLFWADGSPRMMVVLVLQTELANSNDDDGLRAIYARGGNFQAAQGKGTSMISAIRDAIKASGGRTIDEGATLTVRYSGNGVPPNKGFNAPKLYEATYQPPTATKLTTDDLI